MTEFADAIELIKTYGPQLLVVAFILWRDYHREEDMNARIDSLQTETRDVLLPLVKETTAVVARNTAAMERLEHKLA